jgi:signal transduction histidine kinase/flagellar biogenesis protein FliO
MREGNSTSAIPQEKNASPKRGAFFSMQGRLIALILLVLVPILLIQAYFFYSRYQYRRGVELQSNLEIARAVGKTFSIFVRDVLSQELSIGITFTVHDDLTIEQMNEILKKNKAAYPVLRNFAWISPQGRIIASTLPDVIGLDVSERPYFKEIDAGKDWALSDLYPSAVSGEPIFSINRAIRKEDGALLGVVFASVDIARMDDLFAFERARSGAFVILDSKGMLVYRYPAIQTTWEDRNWSRIYPSIYNEVLAGKEVVTTVSAAHEGERRMVAKIPISSIGWIAGAGRGEEAVMEPIISGILRETGLLLFVALASLLAALGLSRTISASVRTLQRHALALGRREAAGIVSASGPAELKDLADAFNLMAEKVQTRETALRESEERYRALLDASSQVLYHMSPDWSEMQLLQGGGFIADTEKSNYNWLQDYIHPDDQKRVIEVIGKAVRTESVFELEHRVRRVDGTLGWTFSRAVPVRGAAGEIVEWFGAASDITERKQMEEELRKSRDELELRVRERTAELNKAMEALQAERQRFHDVLDVLPVYVTLLTPDYHVSFANKVFLQRFGESRGLRCFEHLFSRSEPCEVCDTYKVLKTMQPHQWEWTGPDGRIYEVFDFPFTDTDGSTLILEMGIDITERKQAEEKLGSYMARLEQSNRALQDFASIASHDMKEPLRKVKAFGCRLADKCGPSLGDEGKDYLQRMLHAADRMQGLLDALLHYSRVSTRTEPFRPVDLGAVVKEVLLDLEVRIEKTGGEVQVHELPTVEADPTQMRQLFQNLIGNALKFHKQGERPLVNVDCSANGPGSYVITIEDNGIGFEEEHLDKIFAPFQRLHGRSSSYEGTGMGLAICKKIVERHGGSITARSKPGQGAAFVIIIPKKQH